MPIVTRFSIDPAAALRLGLPYFDVFFTGWGSGTDVTATSDGSGLIYPFAAADVRLPAPRGIMIHPESDFDRVLVETSVGTGIGATVAKTTALNRQSFTVSVDAPLILAPPTIPTATGTPPALPTPTVTLRARPDAIYHNTYAKSGVAALSAFVDAIVPLTDPERSAFGLPRLALRFFLQTPPDKLLRATQTFPRALDNLGGTGQFWDPIAVDVVAASGEQLFAIVPIHGRCCVTPIFRSIDCAPSVRIAVNDFGSGIAPSATPTEGGGQVQTERTLFTSGALTSNVPVQASYATAGDWLMLYYTPADGDDGLLMWQVRTGGCACTAPATIPAPGV
jgi:hypothetical protein